jgi:phosphate transport system substrate-binding protein
MGSPAVNMAVSTRRTEAVAAALQAAGVTPAQAASFGAELPVADNATQAGRERNRRVEAYLSNP